MIISDLIKITKRLCYNSSIYLIASLILFFILTNNIIAQTTKENWVPVNANNSNKIYINTVGLENFKENDIYVWVMEENNPPIIMEGIDAKIYKTKTYFLLNKYLKRYSILQIVFYDSKNNVIKSYNYSRNTDNIDFKYSSPILEGSNVSFVLLKCVEIISSLKK
jgi:hypothetical protein